jgi:hypothetical protein
MIRERVSTQGVIRPLEPESELDAMKQPEDQIGIMSELILRRYLNALDRFNTKFASTIKQVEKHRRKQLELSKKDVTRNMAVLQNSAANAQSKQKGGGTQEKGIKEGLLPSSGSWAWAWALDSDEVPPASSIVARRDTTEARKLAMVADQHAGHEDHITSGNQLWQMLVQRLNASKSDEKEKEVIRHSEPKTPLGSRFFGSRRAKTAVS